MNKYFTSYIYIAGLCILLGFCTACNPEIESDINLGSLRVQQYVAIGDGYTAGYRNDALYLDGQLFSFPRLFSNQLSTVSNLGFRQPLLGERGTGYQYLEEVIPSSCEEGISIPVIKSFQPDGSLDNNVSSSGPFHNLGIPGLEVNSLFDPSLIENNPFYRRITPEDQAISYDQHIMENPSGLYTIWIGTDELMKYAASGASNDSLLPATSGAYKAAVQSLIDTLLTPSRKTSILIGNIPDITAFPFFSTISHIYIQEPSCISAPLFIEVHDANGNLRIREATDTDRILLTARDMIGKPINGTGSWGLSSEFAIDDRFVLDRSEVDLVRSLVENYNLAIQQLVKAYREQSNTHRVISVDLNNYLRNATVSGITVDGLDISGEYLTGGLFSLDGKHFTPRGNAFITNLFIESINKNFQAKVPKVNISDYESVVFP